MKSVKWLGVLTFALALATVPVRADSRVLRPLPQTAVKVGGFWGEQFRMLTVKWLPHCVRQMEKGGRGEEMLNLIATGELNAGKKPSVKFKGCMWSDAYPYNTVEAICLALEVDPGADAEWRAAQGFLRAKVEEWIPIFLAAQDELVSPEHSKRLAAALDAAGIPCRLEIGETGGHGFADGTGMCMEGWPERAIDWFEQR